MKKSSKSTIIVTLLVVAALAFLFIMLSSNFTVTKVKTSEFFNHVGIRYTEDGETFLQGLEDAWMELANTVNHLKQNQYLLV